MFQIQLKHIKKLDFYFFFKLKFPLNFTTTQVNYTSDYQKEELFFSEIIVFSTCLIILNRTIPQKCNTRVYKSVFIFFPDDFQKFSSYRPSFIFTRYFVSNPISLNFWKQKFDFMSFNRNLFPNKSGLLKTPIL